MHQPCARGAVPLHRRAARGGGRAVRARGRAPQNGLKALRALVVATPEWRDAHTRLRLAAEWAAAGGTRAQLAPAVRACAASALRRAHLLALCRAFCFASSLWRRKPTPQRAHARPRATPLALVPASPSPPASAHAFTSWLLELQPSYADVLAPFRDSSLLVAAIASQDAVHLRAAHAAQLALFSRLCFHGAAALRAQTTAADRWRAMCTSRPETAAQPAWAALPAGGLVLETFIRHSNRMIYEAVSAQLPPDASPALRAAAAELRAGAIIGGDTDSRILGALEQLKAEPLPDFLLALTAAAAFWTDWTQRFAAHISQRAAWASTLCEEGPPSADALVIAQPAAPGQLLCATASQDEVLSGMMQDLERQCAALTLTCVTA